MDWKVGLDKYLTTTPDDGFDGWYDDVVGHKISDLFYTENENWIEEPDGQCNKWLNDLFYKRDKLPEESARIIERAFKIYCQ